MAKMKFKSKASRERFFKYVKPKLGKSKSSKLNSSRYVYQTGGDFKGNYYDKKTQDIVDRNGQFVFHI